MFKTAPRSLILFHSVVEPPVNTFLSVPNETLVAASYNGPLSSKLFVEITTLVFCSKYESPNVVVLSHSGIVFAVPGPTVPGLPCGPVGPAGPACPVTPVAPVSPFGPIGPTGPVGPTPPGPV